MSRPRPTALPVEGARIQGPFCDGRRVRITDIQRCEVRPGRLVEWTLSPATVAAATALPEDSRPPAYIQESHIRTAKCVRETGLFVPTWLGTAFDLPGPVDLDALERALHAWTLRHETLRSGFRWKGEELCRFTLDAADVSLHREEAGHFPDAAGLVRHLQDRFDTVADALRWPNLIYTAVVRDDGAKRLHGLRPQQRRRLLPAPDPRRDPGAVRGRAGRDRAGRPRAGRQLHRLLRDRAGRRGRHRRPARDRGPLARVHPPLRRHPAGLPGRPRPDTGRPAAPAADAVRTAGGTRTRRRPSRRTAGRTAAASSGCWPRPGSSCTSWAGSRCTARWCRSHPGEIAVDRLGGLVRGRVPRSRCRWAVPVASRGAAGGARRASGQPVAGPDAAGPGAAPARLRLPADLP